MSYAYGALCRKLVQLQNRFLFLDSNFLSRDLASLAVPVTYGPAAEIFRQWLST